MKHRVNLNHAVGRRPAVSLLALAALTACGGGGGDGLGVVLQGVAAKGVPMAGASVRVWDARNQEVQSCNGPDTCTVGEDGRFSIQLPSAAQAPFVLRATPSGGGEPMVSVSTSETSATVNITPISTLVAAQLSGARDPAALSSADVDAAKLAAAKQAVLTALEPLLTAVNNTVDPLTGSFQADGTGLDKALEVLSVQVIRAADGSAHTVAEVKLSGDGVQQTPSITLTPGSAAPVPQGMAQVSGASLPADGLGPMLQALVRNLNNCYNQPDADRVDSSAGVAVLKAQNCKDLFYGADPASYKHNGYRVGPKTVANTTFNGLFAQRDSSGPNGARNTVVFDQPVYEFTRSGDAAGDVVASYHWRDALGNEDWSQVVLRPQSNALRLYGNQYDYDARVRPISQRRVFVQSGSEAMSYDSSGYNTWVRNHLDAQGNPLFSKVVLTAPNGRTFTLKPNGASDRLGLVKRNADGSLSTSGTSIIRLQWAFLDSSNRVGASSGKDIADLDAGALFARNDNGAASPWTDEAIRALPQQGQWQYAFYLASQPQGEPVVQWVSTQSRAQTLGELREQPFAEVTPAIKANMAALIDTNWNGIPMAGDQVNLTHADGSPSWTLPAEALAPTSINVNGNLFPNHPSNGTGRTSFNDGVSVPSTARSGLIPCSKASNSDAHCDSAAPDRYAPGTFVTTFELWGRNARALERSMLYTFYKLVP